MTIGKIAKFETLGMLDGPGIRTVVFMQGCMLRCAYCHNPALLSFDGGMSFSPKQLLDKILRYQTYYKQTGGVTVSGGEPLAQTAFLIEFFKLCKQKNIHTCLDTSGVGFGNFDELLTYTDLVLLDIKHTTEAGFKELTLIEKSKTEAFHSALISSKKDIWLRQVIIPNYNDNSQYLDSLFKEIRKFQNQIVKIEFLPFHTMAEQIYNEIGMNYRLKGKEAMDALRCKELQDAFIEICLPYLPNLNSQKKQ